MDKEIKLVGFYGVGKVFVHNQMVRIEVSSFLIPDSKPIICTGYYDSEVIKDSIPHDVTFSTIFAFQLFENGMFPQELFSYSDENKISSYTAIQVAVIDAVAQLTKKLGHHLVMDNGDESNVLDGNLKYFNTWGNILIDQKSNGLLVELAAKIENGAVVYCRKGCKTKENQIITNKPVFCEVATVLESGNWPAIYYFAPRIESATDCELAIIVVLSTLEEMRKQIGFYSLGEELKREDDFGNY